MAHWGLFHWAAGLQKLALRALKPFCSSLFMMSPYVHHRHDHSSGLLNFKVGPERVQEKSYVSILIIFCAFLPLAMLTGIKCSCQCHFMRHGKMWQSCCNHSRQQMKEHSQCMLRSKKRLMTVMNHGNSFSYQRCTS